MFSGGGPYTEDVVYIALPEGWLDGFFVQEGGFNICHE